MRILLNAALAFAALVPAAAQAQSQYDIDRDRREVRQDRRDVRDDLRRGEYGRARDDRQEAREDRRDLHRDVADRDRRWARDDWRAWREHDRGLYAAGGWRAPFRYSAFRPGARIQPLYYGPSYVIAQPWRYHLPPAGPGTRWVRHYNDVLLVDPRRGIVVDVIRGFYL